MRLFKILVLVLALGVFFVRAGAETIVTIDSVLGTIKLEMLEDAAPLTVANFLNYVERGDYDGSTLSSITTNEGCRRSAFIERIATNRIIQLSRTRIWILRATPTAIGCMG